MYSLNSFSQIEEAGAVWLLGVESLLLILMPLSTVKVTRSADSSTLGGGGGAAAAVLFTSLSWDIAFV
jgi:hypothetical protein